MLVLTRKLEEAIIIGGQIEIRVLQVRGTGEGAVVRLGITAPKDVTVLRKEVYDEVVAANQAAADHGVVSTELLQVLLRQTVEKPGT
jgi:carbon storage regulator